MRNPDFTRIFILQTDASGVGVGTVLSQGETDDQPIAYSSRKLLPREKVSACHSGERMPCNYACSKTFPSLLSWTTIYHSDRLSCFAVATILQREECSTNQMELNTTAIQLVQSSIERDKSTETLMHCQGWICRTSCQERREEM